jgi:hypothetical protein
MEIAQHPKTTQDRQRGDRQQQRYGNQSGLATRIRHQRHGRDNRKNYSQEGAAKILPLPTRCRRRNPGHNQPEQWTKGAGHQPKCTDPIGERMLHRHLRVILRLVLDEQPEREQQTEDDQKNREADREPIKRTKL